MDELLELVLITIYPVGFFESVLNLAEVFFPGRQKLWGILGEGIWKLKFL